MYHGQLCLGGLYVCIMVANDGSLAKKQQAWASLHASTGATFNGSNNNSRRHSTQSAAATATVNGTSPIQPETTSIDA